MIVIVYIDCLIVACLYRITSVGGSFVYTCALLYHQHRYGKSYFSGIYSEVRPLSPMRRRNNERQNRRKNWLDSGLGRRLRLGSHTFHCLFFPGKNGVGNMGSSPGWRLGVYNSFLLTMAFSFNALLEANASCIWDIFSVCHLGHMIIWWF